MTLRPMWPNVPQRTHVTVAGDVTPRRGLLNTLMGGMQMGFINVLCEYNSGNPRHVWKHYRTQHLYVHTHVCKVKGCKDGKNKKAYGSDEQHTVWTHMATAHKISNPMSCPKCKKIDGFSSKKDREHIPKCEELEGKATKTFGCDFLGCGKRYTT